MKISIITVVLNNRSHIENCIQSVLDQNYHNIEYIVIDGGSTDGTLDVIRKHESRISQWTTGPDGGIYAALNKGIGMATGNIIGFLHSDDYFNDQNVLQKIVDAFSKNNSLCVYGDLLYVNKDDGRAVRYWRAGTFERRLLRRGWMPPHPTLFVRKTVYEKFGCFDTRFKISADYDLVLRLFGSQEVTSHYLPTVLVRMRLGGSSNKSIRNILRKSLEDWRATRSNGMAGGIITVALKNITKIRQFFFRREKFDPPAERVA